MEKIELAIAGTKVFSSAAISALAILGILTIAFRLWRGPSLSPSEKIPLRGNTTWRARLLVFGSMLVFIHLREDVVVANGAVGPWSQRAILFSGLYCWGIYVTILSYIGVETYRECGLRAVAVFAVLSIAYASLRI